MNQRPRYSIWHVDVAGVVVCLAATVLAYTLGIVPVLADQAATTTKYQQLADLQRVTSRLNNTLLVLRSRCTALETQTRETQIKLWYTDQMNGRVAELTGLLDRCGMEVDTLKAGDPIVGPFCDVICIRLSGRGGYRQCQAFLSDLHRAAPDLSPAAFELMANPAKPELGGQFRMDFFWFSAKRPSTS
jgi:Tfp pilus assembly protein PilO